MELYNPIIRGVEELVGSSTPQKYPYDPADAWEDTGAFELVMLRDAAFELGGSGKSAVNFTCVTTSPELVPQDEILVYGSDLSQLKGDSSYSRIALLRVGDIESDDEDEEAHRCEYVGDNGVQCRNMARPGSRFCGLHERMDGVEVSDDPDSLI